MDRYGPETYGDAFADVYDDWYAHVSDVDASTQALRELAQGRRVLELGVGTGRLACPLADQGVEVVGVDASESMLERLAANDPQGAVEAHLMDMSAELPDGPFEVVFVAYNTFFNLTTEAAQRRCLELVRERLSPTGHFLIEAFVPAAEGPDRGVDGRSIDGGVVLNVTIRDAEHQLVRGQQVELRDGSVRLRPWQIRYLHPTQLDDVAAAAGLRRVARWADWSGASFDEQSPRHVSVYAPR